MTKREARRSARGRGHITGVSRSPCRDEGTEGKEEGQQCPLPARGQPRHPVQPCGPPSHLMGGLRARPRGDAEPCPRGPQEAPSDTAAPGQESALPSVICMLRKLPVGPGDPGSPCVGEHATPTMVLLPPLAQGRTSGLSPALSGYERWRDDSPCPSSSSARGPSALPSASPRPFSGAALRAGCIQLILPRRMNSSERHCWTQSPSLLPPSHFTSQGQLTIRSDSLSPATHSRFQMLHHKLGFPSPENIVIPPHPSFF